VADQAAIHKILRCRCDNDVTVSRRSNSEAALHYAIPPSTQCSMCGRCCRIKPINRVGHNRIHTPYMTVLLVVSLPKIPYIHHIYMDLANPTYKGCKGC
jgi:hypothetical protein